jgi:tape measure domain-containing protein
MSGSNTQNIVIAVTSTGVPVVQGGLRGIGASAKEASVSVKELNDALAAVGIGLGVKEIADAIDSYTNLNNRLKSVGTSTDDLTAVYDKLRNVALDTHSSLETTVGLYSRLQLGLKTLGYSQNEVINFTRQLSEAVKLSGASTTESKYAIQDLAHGMAAGSVNGRELNGILREMPSLALLMAKALNVPVGSLKELATKGGISADALIKGFQKMDGELGVQFSKRAVTIGDALTNIKTAWTDAVGRFATSEGVLGSVASALDKVAKNMDLILKSLLVVGAGFAVFVGIPAIIGAVTSAVFALTAAMMANPILAIIALFAAAVVAIQEFGDEILLGVDKTTTLKDLWLSFVQQVSGVFSGLKGFFADMVGEFSLRWGSLIRDMTALDWIRGVTRGLDILLAAFKTIIGDITVGWAIMTQALPELFLGAINMVLHTLGSFVNATLTALNHLDPLSGNKPANLDFSIGTEGVDGGVRKTVEAAAKAGRESRKAFQDAVGGSGTFTTALDGLIPGAQAIGAAREAAKAKDKSDLDKKGQRTPPVIDTKGTDKLQNQLDAIENKWDHVLQAVNEYNKAVSVINAAEAAGKITKEHGDELLGLIKDEEVDKFLSKYDAARKAASDLKVELRDLQGAQKAGIITQQ